MTASVYKSDDCDYIVLNSVNNIGKAFPIVERYEYIHCYLDNDNAGHKATETLTGIFSDKVIDESNRYQPHNDLNDWLKSSLMWKMWCKPSKSPINFMDFDGF